MTTTLLFIGPHGAGKSTLGSSVARALDWRFDDEIGLRLRRQALARDPGAHAALAQPEFDEAVFRHEIERDHRALREGVDRVVETWHPGNLAYAEQRSPAVAEAYREELAAAALHCGALVQPLTLSRRASLVRRSEPGPYGIVDFFRRVGDRAVAIALDWGLDVLPPLATDEMSVDDAVARVVWQVRERRGGIDVSRTRASVVYSHGHGFEVPR